MTFPLTVLHAVPALILAVGLSFEIVAASTCCSGGVSRGFVWPTTPPGLTVDAECSSASPLKLHGRSVARRTCSPSGEWGQVDASGCTFRHPPSSVVVVTSSIASSRTVVNSPSGLAGLEAQLLERLREYGVQSLSPRLSYTSDTSSGTTVLVMAGEALVNVNASILDAFEQEDVLFGFFNFTTFPEVVVYVPSDNCLCGETVSSENFVRVCYAPSITITSSSSCLCYDSSCTCQAPFTAVDAQRSNEQVMCTFQTPTSDLLLNCSTADTDEYCVDDVVSVSSPVLSTSWTQTPACQRARLVCPLRYLGFVHRKCVSNGQWEEPDISECERVDFPPVLYRMKRAVSHVRQSTSVGGGASVDLAQVCYKDTVAQLNPEEHLQRTRFLPPFLPREVSSIAHYLQDLYSLASLTNLFDLSTFNKERVVSLVQDIFSTSVSHRHFWSAWLKKSPQEVNLLLGGTVGIVQELSQKLDLLSLSSSVEGGYEWVVSGNSEFGVWASYTPGGNLTRHAAVVSEGSAVLYLHSFSVDFVGTSSSVVYFENVFNHHLPHLFRNGSSTGLSAIHATVVAVSGDGVTSFTLSFKPSNSTFFASAVCVQWISLPEDDSGLYGGWTDVDLATEVLDDGNYQCTGKGAGVYGLLEVGRIRVSPSALQLYPGDAFTLTCHTSIQPSRPLALAWRLDVPVPTSPGSLLTSGVVEDESSATLTTSILDLQGGDYVFTCLTPGHLSVPETATVTILMPPVTSLAILSCTGNAFNSFATNVTTGSTLCFKCAGSLSEESNTNFTVVWKLSGAVIDPRTTMDYVIDEIKHTLAVRTSTAELSGVYSCELPETGLVAASRVVTVRPGCLPQPFLPPSEVGQELLRSCSRYSSLQSIKPEGNVVWVCDENLTWVGDFSSCSFSSKETSGIFVLSLVVSGLDLVFTEDILDTIESDVAALIPTSASNVSVQIPDIRQSGTYDSLLITCLVETTSLQYNFEVASIFNGSFYLSGRKAMLSFAMSFVLNPDVICGCPLIHTINQTTPLASWDHVGLSRIGLCVIPDYVVSACQGEQCVGVFINASVASSDGQSALYCSLDSDGDGVPNHQDGCDRCCEGEVYGGLQWERTAQGTTDTLLCSTLHPSLNSGTSFKRMCSSRGEWEDISPFGCTFDPMANHSLVLFEVTLNSTISQDQELKNSLLQEVTAALSFPVVSGNVSSLDNNKLLFLLELPMIDREGEGVVLGELRELTLIGGYGIVNNSAYGLKPADDCRCVLGIPGLGSTQEFVGLCRGPEGLPACSCTGGTCQCLYPYSMAVSPDGDPGLKCVHVPPGSTWPSMVPGCQADPNASNCTMETVSPIDWPEVRPCYMAVTACAQEANSGLGDVMRRCSASGEWSAADDSSCERKEARVVRMSMEELLKAFLNDPVLKASGQTSIQSDHVNTISLNGDSLRALTGEGGLFSRDLITAVEYLQAVVTISEQSDLFTHRNFNSQVLFDLISSTLDSRHAMSLADLRQMQPMASVDLLRATERIAIMHARSNGSASGSKQTRPNIDLYIATSEGNSDIAEYGVTIPAEVIAETANQSGSSVPVTIFVLPTQYLPLQFVNESAIPGNLAIFEDVVTVKVGEQQSDQQLLGTPVTITFQLQQKGTDKLITAVCVFWNYSSSNMSLSLGGWSGEGLTTAYNSTSDISTCTSNHLTSFSVLVSVSPITPTEEQDAQDALHVITYIGCALSFTCLLLSVLFFLSMGKRLFGPKEGAKNYISFVHLNLCICLAVGLLVFMAGIENGTSSMAACIVVAVLLHYFFLALFSWMLCEVIVLYNLLVNVFPEKGLHFNRKWWMLFYLCMGWGLPAPVVVITVASRWDHYYVLDTTANCSEETIHANFRSCSRACWLSTNNGVIAAFIVPMLLLIMVNTVLLILVIRSLYRHWKSRASFESARGNSGTRSIGINLFKSIVFLLPLTGLTWILGLFAVNQNSVAQVFAWLFCLFNTSQGIVIFVFYVLRHERVTSRLVVVRGRLAHALRRCLRARKKREMTSTTDKEESALGTENQQLPSASLPQRTVRTIRHIITPLVHGASDSLENTITGDTLVTSPTSMNSSLHSDEFFWEAEV